MLNNRRNITTSTVAANNRNRQFDHSYRNNIHDNNNDSAEQKHPKRSTSSSSSNVHWLLLILTHLIFGVVTFHVGFYLGVTSSDDKTFVCNMYQPFRTLFGGSGSNTVSSTAKLVVDSYTTTNASIFPKSISNVLHSAALLDRQKFIQQYDEIGVPWNENKLGATNVLLLYQSLDSVPDSYFNNTTNTDNTNNREDTTHFKSYDSVTDATKNCYKMKVLLMEPNTKHTCIAIVPQWESYHVHHFLRIKPDNLSSSTKTKRNGVKLFNNIPNFDKDYPLRLVSRVHTLSGKAGPRIPMKYQSTKYWDMLQDYLTKLESTLERLRPIAEQVATSSNNYHQSKTIVVMVCNFGQSELFVNFVCSARARKIDISNILLFATDTHMSTVAKSLHVNVFDVDDAFGMMPTTAARVYGDRIFQGMMLSKVYCVHLINALGYDVLFQDVDVVWYRNPIPYFQSIDSGNFDFYFQDDGAHSTRYTPYSPNSGFYYVRQTDRTRHFFEVFMRLGELIIASGSHQSVMNNLLADHSSSTGLRVKVYDRDSYLGQEFPGGFHYHKRKDFMKTILEGKRSPYIFHMSWTENKNNKQKFYQQLGDWYVNDKCINKKLDEIEIPEGTNGETLDISKLCCSAQPIIKCHYSDKPSKIPCKRSPRIDKRGKSFW